MSVSPSREDRINGINKCLAILSHQIQAGNLAGLTSLNVIAEDILCPILALVLDAPYLISVNAESPNRDTVDLYSPSRRLGVQVTSDTSAKKIRKTLEGALSGSWANSLDRLKFVLVSTQKTDRGSKTKQSWIEATPDGLNFDPNCDVIECISELLKLIKPRPDQDILRIAALLDSSVLGRYSRNIEEKSKALVQSQLQQMRVSGKYLPDVYVESKSAKDLARCFVHPKLFKNWVADELDKLNLSAFDEYLRRNGIASGPFPTSQGLREAKSYPHAIEQAMHSRKSAEHFLAFLGMLRSAIYDKESPLALQVAPESLPRYEEIRSSLYYRLGELSAKLSSLIEALKCLSSQILVLTSHAGQGKTMFCCNIVERTMLGHGVPTAFLTGHRISLCGDKHFHTVLQELLFGGSDLTSIELLELLNSHAQTAGKPYVVVIDGLNEHNSVPIFASRLKDFFIDAVNYPFVRFLLTCRAEFYDARFAGFSDVRTRPC